MSKTVHEDGMIEYRRNGLLHRVSGPAVIKPGSEPEWWYRGKSGIENFPKDKSRSIIRRMIKDGS